MRRSTWTPAMIEHLRSRYGVVPAVEIACELGLGLSTVAKKARALGLRSRPGRKFGSPKKLLPAAPRGAQNNVGKSAEPKRPAKLRAVGTEAQLWAAYIAGGRRDTDLRNQLIAPYVECVRKLAVATQVRTRNWIHADELTRA